MRIVEAGEEVDPEEVRPARDAGEAARAADRFDVEDEHADDLAEAERHDGQVVAAQAQRRQPDDVSADRGRERARRRADEQKHASASRSPRQRRSSSLSRNGGQNVVVTYAADVGADRHEAGVADRELAGDAVDEVEARPRG